jgi:hypothetical protein
LMRTPMWTATPCGIRGRSACRCSLRPHSGRERAAARQRFLPERDP